MHCWNQLVISRTDVLFFGFSHIDYLSETLTLITKKKSSSYYSRGKEVFEGLEYSKETLENKR